MHPPPAHGFPRLVRKKSDWGDWVVSPVWIVMEPTAKRPLNGALAVSPRGFTDTRTRDFTGMVGRDLDTLLCPFGLTSVPGESAVSPRGSSRASRGSLVRQTTTLTKIPIVVKATTMASVFLRESLGFSL